MDLKLQSPSGKFNLEIFKEKEQGYYDYKITNNRNNLTCFIYGQPLKQVYEVIKNLDTINFAQWNKKDSVQNETKNENDEDRGRKTILSQKTIEDIIQSFMNGVAPTALAKKYGISCSSIRWYLDKDERTKNLHINRTLNKKQELEIFELNSLGFDKEEIAEEVGCGWIDVMYHLKNPKFLTEDDLEKYKVTQC